jgi:hypothetical protein
MVVNTLQTITIALASRRVTEPTVPRSAANKGYVI